MYGYGSREYGALNPVQKRFFDAYQEHPSILGYDDLVVDSDVDVEVRTSVVRGNEEDVLFYAQDLADDLGADIIHASTGDGYVDFIFTLL
jgi:hypothetical protein